MRKIFFFFLAFIFLSSVHAQQKYWQQQVNYTIDVSLNDKEHTLTGFVNIEYINNSPDSLHFIWFHIWPNAYKNDRTAFSNQQLKNGNTDFYFSDKENKGYINRLTFRVNNITADIEDHPLHIDIIKLILPTTLAPGAKTFISTSFHVKLPAIFSRSGHDKNNYQLTQWYPKPAVYDRKGWHPMPYLDQGEFYSEFGNYNVQISLPQNYVVAATGELQNKDEFEWMINRKPTSIAEAKKTSIKPNASVAKNQLPKTPTVLTSSKTKTLQYMQNNVHDFAWFASKDFLVSHDTLKLNSGKIIDAFSFYSSSKKELWKNSIQIIKDAVKTRNEWIGEYPYNTVSAVQGWDKISGGMEYPTITVLGEMLDQSILDLILEHEVGHNWFYGILASNERLHPWMDEGLNTFYDNKYLHWQNTKKPKVERAVQSINRQNFENLLLKTKAVSKLDQPIELNAEAFNRTNYGLVVYHKTYKWMEFLEEKMGNTSFANGIKKYYRDWQFKHPYPEDFKSSLQSSTELNLDSIFSLLTKRGVIDPTFVRKWKIASLLSIKKLKEYINYPTKNLLWLNPVMGFNSYDKLMAGLFISNYKLPPSAFQFFVIPMFATGTKKLVGTGKINYTHFSNSAIRKLDVFLNASTFSDYVFTESKNEKTVLTFQKIVPGFRLTFKEKDLTNSIHKHIQFKSFFITEQNLRFNKDTVITGIDTSITNRVNTFGSQRNLQQLDFVIENNRALYPYSANLRIEQSTDFARVAFTGNYFFNYVRGGGMKLRLFAGKFIYMGSKTVRKQLNTDRFHLNMTGADGYEDYTYSDYFIGRNHFDQLASQQIMERDGGFKVRTNLYSNKIGKTDDWLMAINLSSTIPDKINPLQMLPFNIPLKLFLDIGTQSDDWKKNSSSDRFLFDAGLQFPLFNESVNIYVPLLYSNAFKDYIQNTLERKNRFMKTISFSIDISNFNLRKIIPELIY